MFLEVGLLEVGVQVFAGLQRSSEESGCLRLASTVLLSPLEQQGRLPAQGLPEGLK